MLHKDFNSILREMFISLNNDGYKYHPMCNVTLGSASNPQFKSFIDGNSLGIGPLERMISGLQYELHLVPVHKDDKEAKKYINDITYDFVKNSQSNLINHLENRPVAVRGPKQQVKSAFQSTVDSLISGLEEDEKN